ncbi:MAG: hypothetical protein V1779_14610 [bacterium]
MRNNLRIKKITKILLCLLFFISQLNVRLNANGSIVATDSSQQDFLKTYKMILYGAYADYPSLLIDNNTSLFSSVGEFSIYWAKSGTNKGSFILPGPVPSAYASVTSSQFNSYDWTTENHYSIQYKPSTKKIAIFRSKIKHNNNTVSWGAIYFKNMFDTYLYDNIYYFVDEDYLMENFLDGSTQLLIIPSFTLKGEENEYYIDQVFDICPKMKERLDNFLSKGGMIYSENNSAYLIEKLGYLQHGAVDFGDFEKADNQTNLVSINFLDNEHPVNFTKGATGNFLYTNIIPKVSLTGGEILAETQIRKFPAAFELKGAEANSGRIVCNLGLPTIGGMKEAGNGSRQLQWTLNTLLYTFAKSIDVNRSVWNELPDTLTAGKNAVSYDRIDTFEVRIVVRNLSDSPVNNLVITESIRPFFSFVELTSNDVSYTISGNNLTLSNILLNPHSEKTIVYQLRTPDPDDKIHEEVDKYIQNIRNKNCIYASFGTISYEENNTKHLFWKYRDYAEVMFSAFLVADTDLNWKNFLGLYYQPFKVFMIMENKERTSAEETKYVQYIPKDVPFYQTDNAINIPILKTPGGKFIDVLRGSNDQNNPDYDMDSDGHPDVWLDTASIYPKGYKITEESVYWLNPWEHLRTGNTKYYEDLDHDGLTAQDTDGDGIVDIEEPGDKMRVWKVEWNIGRVAGYDYFDPYCSYEIWVDPPPLVELSAGVSQAYGKLDQNVNGMYYPYTPDINDADLSDTTWSYWMERDKDGNVVWKQLIYQRINNYEGFTFIDTAKTGYKLKPTDYCAGTVPQPHNEFIAVLSLGGEEIDMTHYKPTKSEYSNLEYKTIFGEDRTYPIRSTYTYYAPLPNPLQFEYLSNNFTITNNDGDTLKFLPKTGKVNLTFDVDASTEYSYYWIRNAGHDVDYNDASERIEGVEELGDGVFGYMVYDIPKGMGGYKITLPTKPDGTYDINSIVEVDGDIFKKWLDNPNTKNEIEVWEDPYQYHIYVPQLLIPPSLDDNNFDGIDDWIDDRGDRFQSKTGYLHDGFMLDNGEDWPDYPEEPFQDDIYGMVTSGWYHGGDNEYGDDFFENLGKTHFKFKCIYEGQGREGPVDISKGGWLVVEEIFGGSPWVIFSHVLSGYAQGVDFKLTAQANPTFVKYGFDTTYIKFKVKDEGEPHEYDNNFDPYHVSYGYGEASITTYSGGKDPCSLISPSFNMSTIIDPNFNWRTNVTLIPDADPDNPELADYPKTVSGNFLEVKIEVMNGTDDNWINTRITPLLPAELMDTKIVMSYVAYPRPLVPAKVDPVTGEIIQGGDDIGAFKAGWRFNQPEGEVLVKIGNTLPLLQPSRRAYFVFLLNVDTDLKRGTYDVNFNIDGERRHYDENAIGKQKKEKVQSTQIDYDVPPLKFSVSNRDYYGNVTQYQKFVIGTGNLENIKVESTDDYRSTCKAKWSNMDVNYNDFGMLASPIPSSYDNLTGLETIDLSQFKDFPNKDLTEFYILSQGEVLSYGNFENFPITISETLNYNSEPFGKNSSTAGPIFLSTVGPKLDNFKKVNKINGEEPKKDAILTFKSDEPKDIESLVQITNYGNDMAENAILEIEIGPYFKPILEKLPANCTIVDNKIIASMGACVPGEKKQLLLNFTEVEGVCSCMFDTGAVIPSVDVTYRGKSVVPNSEPALYSYKDSEILDLPAVDLNLYDLTASQSKLKYNSDVRLTAKIQNGVTPAENVTVNIYAISNLGDTVLVGSEVFNFIDKFEKIQMNTIYKVEDSLEYIEFLASVQNNVKNSEFCTNNNSRQLQIPFEGPNWIVNVKNYPNPVIHNTYFSYYLPRELRSLSIVIFTLDGQEVTRIKDCPTGLGYNMVYWFCANSPKATYIYKFEGINEKGELVIYNGTMIKD